MVQLHRAGVEARQVEQVHGELLEPVHLVLHRRQELLAGGVVELLVVQQLHEAAEREDRRAQLVRGVRDELAPRPVHALDPLAHHVELVRQAAELVTRVHRQRAARPPLGHVLGGALEPPHAPRQRPRHEVAAEQGHHQGGRARLEQARAHHAHRALHVVELPLVHRHPVRAVAVEERQRDLAHRADVGRHDAAPPREQRAGGEAVRRVDRALGVRVRDHVELRRALKARLLHAEQRHARVRVVGDRAHDQVELRRRRLLVDQPLKLRHRPDGLLLEVVDPLVLELRLELREEHEDDDRECQRRDQQEQKRQLVLQ